MAVDPDRTFMLRILLGGGAAGCALGAGILYLFIYTLAQMNALQAAPTCATPTRSTSSTCLSVLGGQITFEGAVSKGNRRVTIALENTTVDTQYECAESPPAACSSLALRAGTTVVTGWWKGQMVAFGAPGTRPAIVTDFSPIDQARKISIFLALVIPGVSGLLAGLLLLQAPTNVDGLVQSVLARAPDPPRDVDLRLVWRVTLAYSMWGGYWLWAGAFIVLDGVTEFGGYSIQPGAALIFLFGAGVACIGGAALLAPVVPYRTLRTADRRVISVKRFQTLSGRGSTVTKIWYDRLDGREASTQLNADWTDLVRQGDQLQALTDPKTGAVERVVSSPPA